MSRQLSHVHCRTLEVVFLTMAGACTVWLTVLWFGLTSTAS